MSKIKTIYLVSCSKDKKKHDALAKDLYISKRFILSRELAEAYSDQWFILSAQHGLLKPDSLIAPYDKSLLDIDRKTKKRWLNLILQQLEPYLAEETNVVYLGDDHYFREISKWLVSKNVSIFTPFQHLKKEIRIPWLQQAQKSSKRVNDVAMLYSMLQDPLLLKNNLRLVDECSGSMIWPKRGLYIFYEPGYNRMLNYNELKIMRVGTHGVSEGSSSSLWHRLKTHKGNKDLSGNHRSSIFRLHIGTALIVRDGLVCPSWGIGQSSNKCIHELEDKIEKKVSEYIRKMQLLFFGIEDAPSKMSDRAYIEQNMIALLSGPIGPIDLAEESWLGYHCLNPAVRKSSLWNVDYTDMQYDVKFFDVLQTYIDVCAGRISPPTHSLAPPNWYQSAKSGYRQHKLKFDEEEP